MRIGIEAQALEIPEPTGVEVYARGIIAGLAAVGGDNEYLLYVRRRPAELPFELAPSLRFREVPAPRRTPYPLWLHFALPAAAASDQVDVMFFPSHKTFVFARPCPMVSTIFDLGFERFPGTFPRGSRWRLSYYTAAAMRRSAAVVAISESTKRDVVERYGIPSGRVTVAYPGLDRFLLDRVDPSGDAPLAQAYGLPETYLLYFGVLQPRKNVQRMLEAFIAFKKTDRTGTFLVLAGKKGWLYEPVERTLREEEVCRSWVRWIGYVPDHHKWSIYRRARALVFPSYYEGFGIPALEAMACGTPVLYADRSSLPEVVGDAGVPFDPFDPRSMAEAMERIANDDALRRGCHDRGLARAQRFEWADSARQILGCLRAARDGAVP